MKNQEIKISLMCLVKILSHDSSENAPLSIIQICKDYLVLFGNCTDGPVGSILYNKSTRIASFPTRLFSEKIEKVYEKAKISAKQAESIP